jgi:flagellar biosynthetic protein FliR
VDVAGELIGLQMGLSFAVFYDPQNAGQSSTLAEFLGLLATLIFLAMDGHLMVLSVLVESFRLLPVGAAPLAASGLRDIVAWAAIVFSAGVLLALPLIAALLVTNIALGVITRAAPQLNLFAVGFPVTIVMGFGALLLTLPQAAPVLGNLFQQGIDAMGLALQAAR